MKERGEERKEIPEIFMKDCLYFMSAKLINSVDRTASKYILCSNNAPRPRKYSSSTETYQKRNSSKREIFHKKTKYDNKFWTHIRS